MMLQQRGDASGVTARRAGCADAAAGQRREGMTFGGSATKTRREARLAGGHAYAGFSVARGCSPIQVWAWSKAFARASRSSLLKDVLFLHESPTQ